MKEMRKLSSIAILVTINLCFSTSVRSRIFKVGDDEEWNTDTNYGKWSSNYTFKVGDVLVIKYLIGEHNVYEVIESTYRTCNTSTGALVRYESGEDEVELTEARKYWFVCNIPSHCLGGMRFGINVEGSNSTNPVVDRSSHPDNSSSSLIIDKRWRFLVYIALFRFLFKFYR